jgi:hypothetical protein
VSEPLHTTLGLKVAPVVAENKRRSIFASVVNCNTRLPIFRPLFLSQYRHPEQTPKCKLPSFSLIFATGSTKKFGTSDPSARGKCTVGKEKDKITA